LHCCAIRAPSSSSKFKLGAPAPVLGTRRRSRVAASSSPHRYSTQRPSTQHHWLPCASIAVECADCRERSESFFRGSSAISDSAHDPRWYSILLTLYSEQV
jgi:hypothetical protein